MRPAMLRRICGGSSRPNLDLSFSRGDGQIDRRISYSRSGAGVPMVCGPGGVLEFAPHNLCQRSYAIHAQTNRLDDPSRWTANTDGVGPDGAVSGSILTAKAATSWGCQGLVYASSDLPLCVRTVAWVVKKKNHRYIAVRTGGAAGGSPEKYNFYDFDTDTIDNTAAPTMPITRTLLPNDCVRLSLTAAAHSGRSFSVALCASNGDVQTAPAGTESVYVFTGQFVLGPDRPYVESPAAAEGFAPRIAYHPLTGACEGLLVESVKNNQVLRSSDMTNATNWIATAGSGTCGATADAGTAPDGQSTAVVVTCTGATYPRLATTPGAPLSMGANSAFTASLFVKAGTLDKVCLWMRNSTVGTPIVRATFEFSTKTFTFDTGSLAGYEELPDGWFRIWVRGTRDASGSTGTLWITPGAAYDGTSRSGTVYVWGPQVEAADSGCPSSYIPTGGAILNRGGESVKSVGSLFDSWFKSGRAFTVLMKFRLRYFAYYGAPLCIAAGVSGNEVTPYLEPGGGFVLEMKRGGGVQASLGESSGQPDGTIYTVCMRVAENDVALVSSTGLNVRDFDARLPDVVNQLSLLSNAARGGGGFISSNLFEFKHWPIALRDGQMRALVGV